MAVYKVIQDIEAEDHFVWKLSLRQLIYALIAAGLIWFGWWLSGELSVLALILFCILASPFVFLALPLGLDQPNDIWLLARFNFMLKPRERLWQQIGSSYRFLTITSHEEESQAPEKEVLSNSDFNYRLEALSNVLDDRGQVALNDHLASEVVQWEDQRSQQTSSLDGFFQKLLNKQHYKRHEQATQQLHRQADLPPAERRVPSGHPASPTSGRPIPAKLESIQDLKITTLEQMVQNNSPQRAS